MATTFNQQGIGWDCAYRSTYKFDRNSSYRRSRHLNFLPNCAAVLQNPAAEHRYQCRTSMSAGQRPCSGVLRSSTVGKNPSSDRSVSVREVTPVQRLVALPKRQAAAGAQSSAAKPERRQRYYRSHVESLVSFYIVYGTVIRFMVTAPLVWLSLRAALLSLTLNKHSSRPSSA